MRRKPHEYRYDRKGMLDEFIVRNATNLHMERMSATDWHIVVSTATGKQHHIRFKSYYTKVDTE